MSIGGPHEVLPPHERAGFLIVHARSGSARDQ